jgi:cytochrome P450
MLRFDSPVQSTVRSCAVATNVGGTEIAEGELMFVILAAANHDPAKFASPDTFDIARAPNDHLAFGEGIHFCLGANLARMEGEIAISSMLERFPKLRLTNPDAPLEYRGSYLLRGLKTLPMTAA